MFSMQLNKIILKLCLFVFLLLQHFLNAQISESSFRETVLKDYKNDTINYAFIANLSVIDTSITKEEVAEFNIKLDQLIQSFPKKENSNRKEKKRIRKIYDAVHESLFTKYEEVAFFPEIFDKGIYNCVTATAVYAYLFDQLKIPYSIKDEPNHVYLIAYPNTYNIHLETTVPSEYGFSSISEKQIEKIVDDLLKMKLITQEELTRKGHKKIYTDYFYGKQFVEKSALIGMQYYNKALLLYEESKYEEASELAKTASIYYSKPAIDYLVNIATYMMLDTMEFSELEDVEIFLDVFSGLTYQEDYSKEDIEYYIYKIVSNDKADTEFIIKSSELISNFGDEDARIYALDIIYGILMERCLKAEELECGLKYAQELLKIDSENNRAKEGLLYVYKKRITLMPVSDSTLDEIDELEKEYPVIKEDVTIQSFKCFNLLKLIENAYSSRDFEGGETYISKLEYILNNFEKSILINNEYIAMAYLSAGQYYYRFDKLQKAHKYLKRGLDYSPDNKMLNKYLNWTEQEM